MSTKRMELRLGIMKLLPSLLCDGQIFTEWLKFNSLQITSCRFKPIKWQTITENQKRKKYETMKTRKRILCKNGYIAQNNPQYTIDR